MDKDNLIYNAVLAVCSNKITAEDAAKQLYLKHNISKRGFLGWCLPTYRCMLSGEIVKGQIKQSLRRVFLEGIYNDFGKLGLSSALQSYLATIEYYEGQGKNLVGDRKIYNEYYGILTQNRFVDNISNELDEQDCQPDTEGYRKSVYVNVYERNPKARREAIKYHGTKCAVCDMSFEDKYGEMGMGFIHIHHIVPISEIGKEYKINYKTDLVPVCPNCHAMLHRKVNDRTLTVEELKNRLK
ncbi:MAG: HNH endonuclease [Alistipes sp.]|nr:HNH endonuclease [Alistipes sp.]